jgi:hypothetical protein
MMTFAIGKPNDVTRPDRWYNTKAAAGVVTDPDFIKHVDSIQGGG